MRTVESIGNIGLYDGDRFGGSCAFIEWHDSGPDNFRAAFVIGAPTKGAGRGYFSVFQPRAVGDIGMIHLGEAEGDYFGASVGGRIKLR